jgi:transposase
MDRYIGLDAHASSCTLAVVSQSGKRLGSQVVETNGKALIEAIRAIPGHRHLCLEEGALAGWLYEILSPHVDDLVVAAVSGSRGSKSDKKDAFGLAEALRIGAIQRAVYKERGAFGSLAYRAKAHRLLVSDCVRVMLRLKSLLRSRGVPVSGTTVYSETGRTAWVTQLPKAARPVADLLYLQLDALTPLRDQAEQEMLLEARKHRVYRILQSCPGLGPIRTAHLLPIVVTPYRFANKRGFWTYCGLGIVMRSSSDWKRAPSGGLAKAAVRQTRGLNQNFNHVLKAIFKGAATTVIKHAQSDDPLYRHYTQLLAGGTQPELAKLTLARQIASITLSLWRNKENYNPEKLEKTVAQRTA